MLFLLLVTLILFLNVFDTEFFSQVKPVARLLHLQETIHLKCYLIIISSIAICILIIYLEAGD